MLAETRVLVKSTAVTMSSNEFKLTIPYTQVQNHQRQSNEVILACIIPVHTLVKVLLVSRGSEVLFPVCVVCWLGSHKKRVTHAERAVSALAP